MEHKYRFSVVMPVYNVEEYLGEAIDSITTQSIGFRDNIQLILVNDGSPDNSAEICRKYQELYPDNVIYIEKKNGGVSSARNEGMKHIQGEYVNFMDSDDIWDRNAFMEFDRFFRDNEGVRIASGRLIPFGRNHKAYHLDYEYEETKVINITGTYDFPLLRVTQAFLAASLLDGKSFLNGLAISEDLLFINQLILEENRYGLIREAVYNYRRREDGSSAIDGSQQKRSYYEDTPVKVFMALIDRSRDLYGEVVPYIQYLLITDLQWRLKADVPDWMTEEEADTYRGIMKDILSEIDDGIIASQRNMPLWYKSYVLEVKHEGKAYDLAKSVFREMSSEVRLAANIVNADTELYVAATAHEKWLGDEYSIYAEDEKKNIYPFEYVRYPAVDKTGLFPEIKMQGYVHRVKLPLADGAKYRFFLTDGQDMRRLLKIFHNKFSRLTTMEDSFFSTGDWIIRGSKRNISVSKYDKKEAHILAHAYNESIRKKSGNDELISLREKVAKIRNAPALFRHKEWIAAGLDRLTGDELRLAVREINAAAKKNHAKLYFVIKENSSEYATMKKPGKDTTYGSDEHLALQLASSRVITLEGQEEMFNPYGKNWKYLRDLVEYELAYLHIDAIENGSGEPLAVIDRNDMLGAVSWI